MSLIRKESAEQSESNKQLQLSGVADKTSSRPENVIEEDAYVDSVSNILKRDYFPDLVILECQGALLDALSTGDDFRATRLKKRLERLEAPDGVRKEFNRQLKKRKRLQAVCEKERYMRHLTPKNSHLLSPRADTPRFNESGLDAKLDFDSAEDDSELEEDDMGEDTEPSDRLDSNGEASGDARLNISDLSLSLDQFQKKYTSEDNESFQHLLESRNKLNREKYHWQWNGNKIAGARSTAYLENGPASADASIHERSITMADNRPNAPMIKYSGARNDLLFIPATGHLSQTALTAAAHKKIKTVNTRFDSEVSTDTGYSNAIERISSPSVSISSMNSSPNVRGYSFVAGAASPSPSELGAPPMTWGSVPSTPIRSQFRLAETPLRDELHQRLLAKKSRRPTTERKGPILRNSSESIPKFQSGRNLHRTILTPAGERLLSSISSSRRPTDHQASHSYGNSKAYELSDVAKKRAVVTPSMTKHARES
ncbi:nuclear protein DGCR14 [Myxozyma melibiosi]|uniref:Nuclear protein DGCR14 n=1 Tax=Myxozyma melibiosi TaxID=54550 RepID=A0ABR1F825_9ASCO